MWGVAVSPAFQGKCQAKNKSCYIASKNAYNGKWYVFSNIDENKYERSLRKFRRKLRFNAFAGIFVPNVFTDLTIAPAFFEMRKRKINVSAKLRRVFKEMHRCFGDFSYAWRIEVGTHNTKRPHVHILLQLPADVNFVLWFMQYLHEEVWEWGFEENSAEITDITGCFEYITKYMSKSKDEDGIKSQDPIQQEYGRQRFGTSRNVVKPPKSRWSPPEQVDNFGALEKLDQNYELCKANRKAEELSVSKWGVVYERNYYKQLFKEIMRTPYQGGDIGWMELTYWFKNREEMQIYMDFVCPKPYIWQKHKILFPFPHKNEEMNARWEYINETYNKPYEMVEDPLFLIRK